MYFKIQLNNRSDFITVKENAIYRAIRAFNSNADGNITFQDFVDFFTLFFASKKNLRQKIISVLNGLEQHHFFNGNLTESEAKEFFKFLVHFYGLKNEEMTSFEYIFKSLQTYEEFADNVFPIFSENLCIIWI